MTIVGISKKLLKVIGFILGTLLVLFVAFHFWFINHAEQIIEDLVASQSNGKLKLEVKKFKFNWFNRRIELQHAVFYSTDTVARPTAYRFEIDRLKLKVKAVMPIVMEKKFLIDSLHLINPIITVTSLPGTKDTSGRSSDLSIPQEMGRIYNSIQDALKVLKVDRFQIDNGSFQLVNKRDPEPGEKPIVISRLAFFLDNLRVDDGKDSAQQRILFSDNVALQTTHQDIAFPDGRHRLSFSNFRVNIRNRLAEFDSCTIVATKGDSTTSAFKVFFDKLRMTNIDFDTLYHSNVIKADSVYCINPRFRLDIDLKKKTGPAVPVKLDEMIQQLTGDLQLKIVMVENASFDINTMREGRPSSFTSDNNNFELQGLRINQKAAKPLQVERFAMAIRNFENFLRDSAYAIQFDSILINNNRISLSNFAYSELTDARKMNRVMMPQFELYGLSWDHLIINQQLKADRVVMYKPVINYNLAVRPNKKPENIFKTLEEVGNILQLHNLQIVDGEVNLFFRNNARLKLENATTFIQGENLVASRKLGNIQQSVNVLAFSKGVFTMNDLKAELNNVQFTGSHNQMKAASVRITDKNNLTIQAKDMLIHSMMMNNEGKDLTIDGLEWSQGSVKFVSPKEKPKSKGNQLVIRNVHGNNTVLDASLPGKKLTATLNTIALTELSVAGSKTLVKGLNTNGKNISLNGDGSSLEIGSLSLRDGQSSSFNDIVYQKTTDKDSIRIAIPNAKGIPDIASIIAGEMKGDAWEITKPNIRIALGPSENVPGEARKFPSLSLGKLRMIQPDLSFKKLNEKGLAEIDWAGDKDNFIQLSNLVTTKDGNMKASDLSFNIDHFRFDAAKGKKFDSHEGRLVAQLRNPAVNPTEEGGWDWKGVIGALSASNFYIDSLGKKAGKLSIESAKLNELAISASSLLNMRDLVRKNTQFQLKEVTGSYQNASDIFKWNNASYDKQSRRFSVDSVTYQPALSRDEFVKSKPYQTDYLKASTGQISISSFNINRFIQDTVVELGVVAIRNAYLYDFRDMHPPRETGVIRSLPAHLLKKIPGHLLIDTLRVIDAHVSYAELNEKTNREGQIEVSHLNARVTRLRNYELKENDSLTIHATAKLQDAIPIWLDLRESYSDSLGGFLMTTRMGKADLTVLNPVLIPLVGAQLKSGILDTMTLRVAGREYLAYGEMNMYYHDLKVKIVGKDDKKRGFLSGILNSLVNTIIKNKNTNRTGTAFFVRLRDRSAMNYLVKITLSGVSSSVGFKKNKKLVRKYKREILNRNLPPVELNAIDND